MAHPTPFYRQVLLEVERRRQQMNLSQERLGEIAGIADRSYSKYLHPDTNNGRIAQWPTLQAVLETLFPDGFDVEIRPRKGPQLTALSMKYQIRVAAAVNDRRAQRQLMRELGARGGRARAEKLSPERRREIASIGARARQVNEFLA